MRYAAAKADGTVHIIDLAPKSVTVGTDVFGVSHWERLDGGGYKVTFYNEVERVPYTISFDRRGRSPNATLTFHTPEDVMAKTGLTPTEVVPITAADEAALTDRTFRDAWTIVNSKVTTDMPKARNVHRQHLRAARTPKLLQADVDYLKALEASVRTGLAPETPEYAELEAIAVRKQKLRDIPQMPEIEAAQTPEELKAVWPPELA